MLLTPLIRRQLVIFAVISAAALGLTFFRYAEAPASLGLGVRHVTADFTDASGLYVRARVTYRGVNVGKVTDLSLGEDGAVATLRLDSGAAIPAGATAEIRSTSAIGEQYVNLVADSGAGPYLGDGARIPRERTIDMPQITPVLDSVNRLLESVPRQQARRLLSQVDEGLGGAGTDIGQLIDDSARLVAEAQANIDSTNSLIAALDPVLATQQQLAPSTRQYASALNDLTETVAAGNSADLRALLAAAPRGLDSASRTVKSLKPTLPLLVYNLTTNAQVLNTYLPQLRQTLVVYPPTVVRLQGMANPGAAGDGFARIDVRAAVDNPPGCQSGYLPPSQRRDPSRLTPREVDRLAHCKIPAPDPTAVRGARNLPCPNSSLRGPLPIDCGLTFRGGQWPASSRSVAFDLVIGNSAVGDDPADSKGKEEGWKLLVLTPLAVR